MVTTVIIVIGYAEEDCSHAMPRIVNYIVRGRGHDIIFELSRLEHQRRALMEVHVL